MAQSNALREQPSMDEILASIRRIIDAGESQARSHSQAAEAAPVQPTVPPQAANDEAAVRARMPQAGLTQTPATPRVDSDAGKPAVAESVADYFEKERGTSPETVADPETTKPDAASELTISALPEPDISEVEAALRAEFSPVDREVLSAERRAKYDARFSEADSGAFRQVGSLLRGKVEEVMAATPKRQPGALVSEAVSQSVSHSFANLSDMLAERNGRDLEAVAEDMLRPMLQEWLDNNLPSLVERLVRSEIERIARGEPRSV